MVNGDPANFHTVKLGQPAHVMVEPEAIVSKPYDFHHGAQASVSEDRSKGFPIMSIRRPRNAAAGNPIAFVAFHHGGLTFNRPDAFRRIVPGIVHER
jgi:hypothetical protein